MTLYHIRTQRKPHTDSLICNANFHNDIAAIQGARRLLRNGEALEVWRAEKLIYHTGLCATVIETLPTTKATDRLMHAGSSLLQHIGEYLRQTPISSIHR